MYTKYFISFSFIVLLISCSSTKHSFEDYGGVLISIGFGGGFSGEYKEYSLLETGEVYINNNLTNKKDYVGKIDKNFTAQIFESSKILKLDKFKLSNPGNMNRYIIYKDKQTENKILWSFGQNSNNNLNVFYQNLMNSIKKIKK